MDFEFSPKEQAFSEVVEKWLDEHHDPVVMDLTRENFSQLCDTPERRAFMKKLASRGWLGMSWPKEYGGQEEEGVYEYILNEALARRAAPQIGKGVGIIGKTLIRHGNEKLKKEFLPKIINAEIEFAVGYSEPQAGSDAANMQLRADKVEGGWKLGNAASYNRELALYTSDCLEYVKTTQPKAWEKGASVPPWPSAAKAVTRSSRRSAQSRGPLASKHSSTGIGRSSGVSAASTSPSPGASPSSLHLPSSLR